jgi:hypothetical protein
MVLKVREALIGRRTALINAVRGHAAEFGMVGACLRKRGGCSSP